MTDKNSQTYRQKDKQKNKRTGQTPRDRSDRQAPRHRSDRQRQSPAYIRRPGVYAFIHSSITYAIHSNKGIHVEVYKEKLPNWHSPSLLPPHHSLTYLLTHPLPDPVTHSLTDLTEFGLIITEGAGESLFTKISYSNHPTVVTDVHSIGIAGENFCTLYSFRHKILMLL
jgi:hypothetical protein